MITTHPTPMNQRGAYDLCPGDAGRNSYSHRWYRYGFPGCYARCMYWYMRKVRSVTCTARKRYQSYVFEASLIVIFSVPHQLECPRFIHGDSSLDGRYLPLEMHWSVFFSKAFVCNKYYIPWTIMRWTRPLWKHCGIEFRIPCGDQSIYIALSTRRINIHDHGGCMYGTPSVHNFPISRVPYLSITFLNSNPSISSIWSTLLPLITDSGRFMIMAVMQIRLYPVAPCSFAQHNQKHPTFGGVQS